MISYTKQFLVTVLLVVCSAGSSVAQKDATLYRVRKIFIRTQSTIERIPTLPNGLMLL